MTNIENGKSVTTWTIADRLYLALSASFSRFLLAMQ